MSSAGPRPTTGRGSSKDPWTGGIWSPGFWALLCCGLPPQLGTSHGTPGAVVSLSVAFPSCGHEYQLRSDGGQLLHTSGAAQMSFPQRGLLCPPIFYTYSVCILFVSLLSFYLSPLTEHQQLAEAAPSPAVHPGLPAHLQPYEMSSISTQLTAPLCLRAFAAAVPLLQSKLSVLQNLHQAYEVPPPRGSMSPLRAPEAPWTPQ